MTRLSLLQLAPAFALVFAGCNAASPERAPAEAAPREEIVLDAAAQQNAGITIETIRQMTRTEQLTAPGLIAIDETRTARVGSLQEGLVLAIRADVGSRVRAGQLLATMHGHAVHDAWAGYRKAVAERRRAEKALTFALDASARAGRLYASKAISLREQQLAEVEAVAAKEQVAMAEAEVRRSIEELEHIGIVVDEQAGEAAAETREQIPVKTPLAGVVLERLVTPGTTVTPGTPMFVVSELSKLWAIAEVDETHLARLRVGRPVSIRVAAYPDEAFPGTITFIGDMVNPKTRRVTVRAAVANPDGRLKPEMFATITIGESEPRQVTVVPGEAIQTIDGSEVVFVTRDGRRFTPVRITTGSEAAEGVEVVSGLEHDSRIATHGSFVLKSELLKGQTEGGE
jgi:cobalt-zinc-cadmium efflux system membrane fusion protein